MLLELQRAQVAVNDDGDPTSAAARLDQFERGAARRTAALILQT